MDEIGALAASVFADGCPPETVRELMGTREGYDRGAWQRWARETGLPGLAVPEEYGGGAFGAGVLTDVFEAAGSALVCAPLLSTVGMAVPVLLGSGDPEAAKRWLPAICDGSLTATVAESTAAARPDGPPAVTASRAGDGWRLGGRVERVVDGATADLILVIATAPDGRGVFAVNGSDADATPLMSLDLTRRQAALTLDGTPAVRVGGPDDGWVDGALDTTRVLLAAELVGVAQRCLDVTVAYTSQRIQFGRPIGSFQAIKQRAADMLIKVELARSAVFHAREVLDDAEERPVAAALAKAFCAEAATAVTAETIQLHGGIGFTWEHDAHLYFKRAISDDELLGPAPSQWARVTAHLDRTF